VAPALKYVYSPNLLFSLREKIKILFLLGIFKTFLFHEMFGILKKSQIPFDDFG